MKRRIDILGDRRFIGSAFLLAASVTLVVTWVNILSKLQDAHNQGINLDWRVPLVEEATSGLVVLALFVLPWRLSQLRPSGRLGWAGLAAVQLAASMLFAALHVTGLVLLRAIAFPAIGLADRYGGFSELIYEWRKDLVVYFAGIGLILLVRFASERLEASTPAPRRTDLLEFRDGVKRLRIRAADILAAHAAGNYVELILRDGRQPLIRTTLNKLELELVPRGAVRVHRSWLVDLESVRVIEPRSGGDCLLILDSGLSVPCSRRHAVAIAPRSN